MTATSPPCRRAPAPQIGPHEVAFPFTVAAWSSSGITCPQPCPELGESDPTQPHLAEQNPAGPLKG
jgi:hypothetical protein